jgi:integrase/recombinase XerD
MTRFEELIYQFKKELQLRKYADSSIKTYSDCLAVFLRAMNGKPKPLPIECIKDFLLGIKNANYHKQFTATIHHFYALVLKTPLSLADIPYPRRTDYMPEIFSVQEVYKLINGYSNLKHRCIIGVFYACALRIGEIQNILLSHINYDRSILRIKDAKGFKDRDVYMPKDTLVMVVNYIEKYKPKKWLFEGQYGEQYSTRSIQQIFWQGVNRIGIKRSVRPHSLRHSRAVHLKETNVDIKDISDLLGHYHIKTTADFYLKLAKLSLCDRLAKADEILSATYNKSNKLLVA